MIPGNRVGPHWGGGEVKFLLRKIKKKKLSKSYSQKPIGKQSYYLQLYGSILRYSCITFLQILNQTVGWDHIGGVGQIFTMEIIEKRLGNSSSQKPIGQKKLVWKHSPIKLIQVSSNHEPWG